MSKKNRELEKEQAEAEAAELAKKSAAQPADAKKQAEKRKKPDRNKKPNIFVRMGRKIKETFSELKRVTWPTFGRALKATGIVLVIVLVFVVVITGINSGLAALLDLMTNA